MGPESNNAGDGTIPTAFAQAFQAAQMRQGQMAWARLDGGGRLLEHGGDWPYFGWDRPRAGDAALECLPILQGLLAPGDHHFLPDIGLHTGVSADLWVFPDGPGIGLVLRDVTRSVLQRARMQQEGNQLSLVNARLTGRNLGSMVKSPDDLLSLLKMAVFEWDAGGRFVALGSVASWVDGFVESVTLPDGNRATVLVRGDGLGFLDNFLEDAEDFWGRGAPGYLASGVWCEEDEVQGECCFEAMAVMDGEGKRTLVLERVDARFAERQRVLQGARQAHLEFESLLGEVQKKEVLLQCIVHDLRGPLSNMMAVLELLRGKRLEPGKVEELLDLAHRQAERQDHMMRELLDIFAAELAALQSFETDPLLAPDLVEALRVRAQEKAPAFDAAGVSLELDIPQGVERLPVAGDRQRLDRVLGNLLGNALTHAPQGSRVELCLREGPTTEPPMVEVCVLDRGPGVPKDLQEKIFHRFVQGGGTGGSVGLGLYFCRNTLRVWGGNCGYRDRPGGGAEFWIRLRRLDHMPGSG